MVSPTNKKRGLCSNRRSTRRWANRRPGESRHHHGSVIVAGARPRHLCACHPFVLHVSVARTAKSGEGAVAVHPDGAAHGSPVNPTTFRHSSHGRTCCSPPSGCQARSRQRRWPGGPGFTARWWGADNRTCDQITRTQLLHLRCFAPRSSSSPSLHRWPEWRARRSVWHHHIKPIVTWRNGWSMEMLRVSLAAVLQRSIKAEVGPIPMSR